jgi:predicted metal-dependent phosphoesterase TrpH
MGADNSPKPMYKDVADIIHKAGGLVFLAHPFEYKFDDKNNWIEQSKYINGKKLYVWKRKIIYYE